MEKFGYFRVKWPKFDLRCWKNTWEFFFFFARAKQASSVFPLKAADGITLKAPLQWFLSWTELLNYRCMYKQRNNRCNDGKKNQGSVSFDGAEWTLTSLTNDTERMGHKINEWLSKVDLFSTNIYLYAPPRGRCSVNFWENKDEWVKSPAFRVWAQTLGLEPNGVNNNDSVRKAIMEAQRESKRRAREG